MPGRLPEMIVVGAKPFGGINDLLQLVVGHVLVEPQRRQRALGNSLAFPLLLAGRERIPVKLMMPHVVPILTETAGRAVEFFVQLDRV